ncbi:MAG TPA: ABC transporter substrate-binding protein [Mycobacterium sp.]
MRRTRAVGLTALAAAATLVIAACSGTPGQQSSTTTAGTGAETSGSAAATDGAGGVDATSLPGAENVGKIGGSGCGIPHGPYEEPAEKGGEVRVAWNDPPLSFNNNTSHGNATAIANIMYLTNTGFTYYDKDLNLINNDQFGTCEIISLEPLTVKYTVNEGVTWSDGVQISAADMVLSWGAMSGVFNDEKAQTDDEGNLLPTTGVAFDQSIPSLVPIKDYPVIGDDGRSATFTWSEYYVDYQEGGPVNARTAGTLIPAHVVGQKALGITDPAQASQALMDAFKNKDKAQLKPIADFWNTGFDTDQLPSDPSLYLSSGPYKVTAYAQRANLTLERNPDYDWGPIPSIDKISYSIIGDPTAAVQALTNEEIDVIQPQATADIYQAVSGLADRGIEVKTGFIGTYEHVDLVFANGGPFDPAKYGGDTDKALKVRQAFLKTVPRQDIVDRLIKPINPDSTVRNSYTTVPGSPRYDAITAENGQEEAYGVVDIAGAQQLLTEAGVTTPIDVRFKFAANNPRRANEYDLIKASAQQAGFNLINGSSPSWSAELPAIDGYDASLFGWNSTATGVGDSQANFITDGSNNYGKFSSQQVDDAYDVLMGSVLEPAELNEQLITVEQQLVDNAFGVTIFQHPGVTAWNGTKVEGVSTITISPSVFFNFWEWTSPS